MKNADNVSKYTPLKIEAKWSKIWEKSKIYQPNLDKAEKPFYNLMMFPYPSAEGLHVGSVFTFTGADTYGRFKRMQGFDVFEPIGLDGFGIHSENYALKVGRHPKEQAKISEENFYRQLRLLGNGFDWPLKLETYDPSYYKWTQWIFIQLFKKGLAYRKKASVNFCPKDKTVLADEQVISGRCERCETTVEKRELEQWFFKITDYAERLLSNIEKLNWTEKVKTAQREWIGRSEGALIEFKIQNSPPIKLGSKFKIEVFTTRPDTLFGATFVVLAPEHPIVASLLKSKIKNQKSKIKEIEEYVQRAQTKTDQERIAEGKEKTGLDTGLRVINPASGEEIPVWIADYVLMGYGTGAIMAVPAHDLRDYEFAKRYKLPIKFVIRPLDTKAEDLKEAYVGPGEVINSGDDWNGYFVPDAIPKIINDLEKKRIGRKKIQYHLRDWLISRQRYWGPPIPMIYCENCAKKTQNSDFRLQNDGERQNPGWFAVSEEQLPVLLPDVEDWKPKEGDISPLANIKEFVETACPKCGGRARRETDVSDTFLDSAWYFFRYISKEAGDRPFDKKRAQKWLPVAMYIGGAEHSVLHLLYSRFITMVFKDLGLIDFEEPFARFYAHGLIVKDGAKMSKSRGNVINPDEYLAKYGADTLRCYLRFIGPFDTGGDFRDFGIEGMHRFLRRVWRLVCESSKNSHKTPAIEDKEKEVLERIMHKTIKKVTEDLESLRYNTAIAHIMEYYNQLSGFYTEHKRLDSKYNKALVLLLAPFAPFLAEELWEVLGQKYSVHTQSWPVYSRKMIKEKEAIVVVEVDGKIRDTIKIQNLAGQETGKNQKYVEQMARASDKVNKHIQGKTVGKIIYIEGKVINFVLE